jgi:hypothetical protein
MAYNKLIRSIILGICCCFFFDKGLTQNFVKTKFKSLLLEINISPQYDNNILRYSDLYIEKFKNGYDVGRFHISSIDDVMLYTSLNSSFVFRLFKQKDTRFDFDFSRRNYFKNPIKSWNYFNFVIEQELSDKTKISLNYSYIPYYYIRHYRDNDWVDIYGYTQETFKPQSFTKESYLFSTRHVLPHRLAIKIDLGYSRYFYNSHFTEYDCVNYYSGIKSYYSLRNILKTSLGIRFEYSDSNQKNKESIFLSDYPNPSNMEGGIQIDLEVNIPNFLKKENGIEMNAQFQKRIYTSSNYFKNDPLHAGRVDDEFDVYASYWIKLLRNLKITAFNQFLSRSLLNSIEINTEYLSNEKSYRQNITGIKFTYQFKHH